MTPGGRVAAAIEILDDILAGAPAERALTRWTRASRFAGSKDRAAIRDHVFDVLRRRRSALWCAGQAEETGRALMLGLLAQESADAARAVFTGDGHAPSALTAEEATALRGLDDAPLGVRADLPAALEDILMAGLGPRCEEAMAAQRDRAPVDLRVNTLKTDRATAQRLLAVEGIDVVPIEGMENALRVRGNARKLASTRAYLYGYVELQDVASQLVARLAAPRPGTSVLDLCAGGGGKTLAMAALMAGRGRLFAYDINPNRMKDLPKRAARAGAEVTLLDAEALAAGPRHDLILIDAPCSGSGSWRRDPDNKWRMTPERLDGLIATQAQILADAPRLLAPGGTIVYATCSILPQENGAQVARFLEDQPGFRLESELTLLPGQPGDGFFAARLVTA